MYSSTFIYIYLSLSIYTSIHYNLYTLSHDFRRPVGALDGQRNYGTQWGKAAVYISISICSYVYLSIYLYLSISLYYNLYPPIPYLRCPVGALDGQRQPRHAVLYFYLSIYLSLSIYLYLSISLSIIISTPWFLSCRCARWARTTTALYICLYLYL